MVVNMAKRKEELADIRKISDEDIKTIVLDLKGELFLLRTKQTTCHEYKSSKFCRIRKNIARMLTMKREGKLRHNYVAHSKNNSFILRTDKLLIALLVMWSFLQSHETFTSFTMRELSLVENGTLYDFGQVITAVTFSAISY